MIKDARQTRWRQLTVVAAGVLLLVLVLLSLLWLRSMVSATYAASERQLSSLFQAEVLGEPGQFDFSFSELERSAQLAFGLPFIDGFIVQKKWEENERIVYPFWAADPLALVQGHGFDTIEIKNNRGVPIGQVNVAFDARPRALVTMLVWAVGATTLFVLAYFISILAKQGQQLQSTLIRLEEKRRELILTERLALAGRLAASLLHDLRKPVNALGALAEDAEEGAVASDLVRKEVQLFRQMLRGSGLERFAGSAGRPDTDSDEEWVELGEMVERSLALVEHEGTGIEVRVEKAANPLLLKAKPFEIIQVLSNLILNAYQILKSDGVIIIGWRSKGTPPEIEIYVEDSGPGIPALQYSEIFEPFATGRSDEGGTGLGLYIVREIVRGWGGTISVSAGPTLGGARFVLTMPYSERGADNA